MRTIRSFGDSSSYPTTTAISISTASTARARSVSPSQLKHPNLPSATGRTFIMMISSGLAQPRHPPRALLGSGTPCTRGSTIHYPDLTNFKGIRVTANPLRTIRRFSITATYGTYVGSEYIGPKLAPLQFTCEQAPFTGVYEFATSEDTTLDLAALPDDESSKMVVATVALTTNLSQEQIQITKPQARSGWIQAELGIDPETGYVSSIAFYLDKNTEWS